jgi:transcription initiation factor TFIID TATA-box-binding protein
MAAATTPTLAVAIVDEFDDDDDGDDGVRPLIVPRHIDSAVSESFLRSAPILRCKNTVVTCSLNARIDPMSVTRAFPGLFVDPKKFAAGTDRTPHAVNLFFSSGKIVCAGANSLQRARQECRSLAQRWLRMGQLVHLSDFATQNTVWSGCAGFYIDLEAIARACPIDVHYVPDNFPGLLFRFRSPLIVCLIFLAGPVILTGCRHEADVHACWAWLYNFVLRRYRLRHVSELSSATYHARALVADDTSAADMSAVYRERRARTCACDPANESPASAASHAHAADAAHRAMMDSLTDVFESVRLATTTTPSASASAPASALAQLFDASDFARRDAERRLAERTSARTVRSSAFADTMRREQSTPP